MKIFYYYHISKCGGTFVHHNLRSLAKQLASSFVSFSSLKGSAIPSEENVEKISSFLENLPVDIAKNRFKSNKYLFIHHHHRFPGLKAMLPDIKKCASKLKNNGHKLYLLTTVRDPADWLMSAINYSNQKKASQLDFENYSSGFYDGQSKYLLYNTSSWGMTGPLEERDAKDLRVILNAIDGLYTVDNIEALEASFKRWIDEDFSWNKSKINASRPKKIISPSSLQRELFSKRSPTDAWLYSKAEGNFK